MSLIPGFLLKLQQNFSEEKRLLLDKYFCQILLKLKMYKYFLKLIYFDHNLERLKKKKVKQKFS